MDTSTSNKLRTAEPLKLMIGGVYRSINNDYVTITQAIDSDHELYQKGFRWLDAEKVAYTDAGSYTVNDLPHEYDLIEQMPEDFITRTETTTETVVVDGFFGRLVGKIRRNPKKTAAVVATGVGVGAYGTYNYRHHGSVLPQRFVRTGRNSGERIAAVAKLVTSFR